MPTTHDPRPSTTHDPRKHDPRPTTHDSRLTTHDGGAGGRRVFFAESLIIKYYSITTYDNVYACFL